MIRAVCPTCGVKAVPLSHKLAAAADTLVVAQCGACKAFATIEPNRIIWLGFPELVAVPVGGAVFLATQHLSAAVQTGALAYALAFAVAVYREPLSAFVPPSTSSLSIKRITLIALLFGVLICVVALAELLS
jgi:hypothetical protein